MPPSEDFVATSRLPAHKVQTQNHTLADSLMLRFAQSWPAILNTRVPLELRHPLWKGLRADVDCALVALPQRA